MRLAEFEVVDDGAAHDVVEAAHELLAHLESWVRSAGVRTSIHSACSRTKRAVVCAAMALPAA